MKHFSPLGQRSLCGSAIGRYSSTTVVMADVTCTRCRLLIVKESATGADLWALEAAEFLRKCPADVVTPEHVRALYVIALEKREAELQRAREHAEHVMDRLAETAQRAVDAGVVR